MYRKGLEYLEEWKNRKRKPLILRGARQVGKTYLVRKFAELFFNNYIEINFDDMPEKAKYFENNDVDEIITLIETDYNKKVQIGKTLLFFDEIQSAPIVFHKLRYFYEKYPDLHIITAGSLLDFMFSDYEYSMPVGRVEYMFLGPMTFSEFLLANKEDNLLKYLKQYNLSKTIPKPIHNKLMKYFNLFLVVGGMPGVIKNYLNSDKKLINISREQNSIIKSYIDDLNKYAKRIKPNVVQNTFQKTPSLIGKTVKYININSDKKPHVIKASLELLELAKVIKRVYHSASNGVPLGAEKKEKQFKLLFLDVGLMSSILGLKLNEIYLLDDIMMINKGDVCEQFIGQHLLYMKDFYIEPEIYFWHRQKKNAEAELDFVYDYGNKIIPIEVKSGKTGTLKSLHKFITEKQLKIGIRFNTDLPSLYENKSKRNSYYILSLPLYMVEFVENILKNVMNK